MLRLGLVFGSGIVILGLLHSLTRGMPADLPLVQAFDLDTEGNLPTWYASILWALVAASACVCYLAEKAAATKQRFSKMWLLIAFVFLVASADEAAAIHETVGSLLQAARFSGVGESILRALQVNQPSANSPWIIYYLPPLLLFGATAGCFLWSRLFSQKLLLSFCIFAASCFGIAIICDHYQGLDFVKRIAIADNLHASRVDLVEQSILYEETLENLGTLLLLLAFVGYASQNWPALRTTFQHPD